MSEQNSDILAHSISSEHVRRYAQAQYAAIFENANEAIICIDTSGEITRANPAVEQVFGYSATELIGQNVSCLMPAPLRIQHDSFIRRYLETGEARIIGTGREVSGQRKDGSQVPLDLSIFEIEVDGIHSFTGIFRDLTEARRAEALEQERKQMLHDAREHLTQVDRQRVANTLVAGISHELAQPLSAIGLFAKSCTRLLERDEIDRELLATTLQRIQRLSKKAGDIIQHLKSLTKPEQSKFRIVEINSLIESAVAMALFDCRTHNIKLEMHLAPNLPKINIADNQVQLVLMHLIRNARDALAKDDSSTEKYIRIFSEQVDDYFVKVTVQDSGPGIAADNVQRIFEPFHTDNQFSHNGGKSGLGIGLSISRGITENHGGKLHVNTEYNNGAEFYFTLPIAETDAVA